MSLSVLPVVRVQFPAMVEYFEGLFLADHTLPTHSEPEWQKKAQSPLSGVTQPVEIERT